MRHWTLVCGASDSGTPQAAEACAELAAHPQLLTGPFGICPEIIVAADPVASVTGTLNGQTVSLVNARPQCPEPSWEQLHALFTGS